MKKSALLLPISVLLLGACNPPVPLPAVDCALIRYQPSAKEVAALGYEPQASAHLLCDNGKLYKVRFDDERIWAGDSSSSNLPERDWVRAVIYGSPSRAEPEPASLFVLTDGRLFRGSPEGPLTDIDADSLQAVVLRDESFFSEQWADIEGRFLHNSAKDLQPNGHP